MLSSHARGVARIMEWVPNFLFLDIFLVKIILSAILISRGGVGARAPKDKVASCVLF
jgi:hypothetical protein